MIERRETPRYEAAEDRVWLGWWGDSNDFQAIAARLDNISWGGARLFSPVPPVTEEDIWMRLGTEVVSECVRAVVLDVRPRPEGDYVVRLEFEGPCPGDFFHTVVTGNPAVALPPWMVEAIGV
jgi:hypothetical protein